MAFIQFIQCETPDSRDLFITFANTIEYMGWSSRKKMRPIRKVSVMELLGNYFLRGFIGNEVDK